MNVSFGRNSGMLRALLLLGTPVLMGLVSVIHPHLSSDNILAELQPQLDVWLAVHIGQLAGVALLGVEIWLLIDGLGGRVAQVARLAVILFLVFYAAFDAVVGIGTGVLATVARAYSSQDQAIMGRLVQQFWNARFGVPIGPLILIADLAWVIALLASAVAVRRAGSSWLIVGALVLAAISFGIDHPFPFGTVGMLSLLVAAFLLQRQALPQTRQSAAMRR